MQKIQLEKKRLEGERAAREERNRMYADFHKARQETLNEDNTNGEMEYIEEGAREEESMIIDQTQEMDPRFIVGGSGTLDAEYESQKFLETLKSYQ